MAKPKSKFPDFDLPPDGDGSPRFPRLIGASDAIPFMRCSRQTFFNRVRDGIYRTAEVRATDPVPTQQLFRLPELIIDEERRVYECLRRGEKTGWEPAR